MSLDPNVMQAIVTVGQNCGIIDTNGRVIPKEKWADGAAKFIAQSNLVVPLEPEKIDGNSVSVRTVPSTGKSTLNEVTLEKVLEIYERQRASELRMPLSLLNVAAEKGIPLPTFSGTVEQDCAEMVEFITKIVHLEILPPTQLLPTQPPSPGPGTAPTPGPATAPPPPPPPPMKLPPPKEATIRISKKPAAKLTEKERIEKEKIEQKTAQFIAVADELGARFKKGSGLKPLAPKEPILVKGEKPEKSPGQILADLKASHVGTEAVKAEKTLSHEEAKLNASITATKERSNRRTKFAPVIGATPLADKRLPENVRAEEEEKKADRRKAAEKRTEQK